MPCVHRVPWGTSVPLCRRIHGIPDGSPHRFDSVADSIHSSTNSVGRTDGGTYGDTNGCGSCSAAVASDHRFCGDCGRAVRVACGYCGATVPFRRYCAQCGLLLRRSLLQLGSQASPLAPAEAAPAGVTSIERLHDAAVEGAVQRNPPPTDLTAKIRAAGSDIVGERRKVVVLFSDVSGFTAMSEKMDPEEVHEIMNECFTGLVEVIYRYEGYIDKFIGDCIMALFGAPLAHEDDVARALLASLDMEA